jgi:serine/threonine protein kinase
LIKAGGFGEVYQLQLNRDPRIAGDFAYKEFTSDHAMQVRSARLAVEFRKGLSASDQEVLDEFYAWPQALVESSPGEVCGLLMPLLTDDFFARLVDPISGESSKKPRDLVWLTTSENQRRAAGVDVHDLGLTERLVILAQLCYSIAWLHRRGWVYGDLNLHNAVFALDPVSVKLLDCDSAAPLSDNRRRQGHQLGWAPPECSNDDVAQDTVTDVYKLGLAVLRCLTPGKHASTRTSPRKLQGVLDPSGYELIKDALSNRDERPSSKELYCYLRDAAEARMGPPQVNRIDLQTRRWIRGQDLRIHWDVTGATAATITTGTGQRESVDMAPNATGYTLRPEISGPVFVEFRNKFGSVAVDLGDVALFELPAFSTSQQPQLRPYVPVLPTVDVFDFIRRRFAGARDLLMFPDLKMDMPHAGEGVSVR